MFDCLTRHITLSNKHVRLTLSDLHRIAVAITRGTLHIVYLRIKCGYKIMCVCLTNFVHNGLGIEIASIVTRMFDKR